MKSLVSFFIVLAMIRIVTVSTVAVAQADSSNQASKDVARNQIVRLFVSKLDNSPRWDWQIIFGPQFRGVVEHPDLVKDQYLIELVDHRRMTLSSDELSFILTTGDTDGMRNFQAGSSMYSNFSINHAPKDVPENPPPGIIRIYVVGATWCAFCKPRTGSLLAILGSSRGQKSNIEIQYLEFHARSDENLKLPILQAFLSAGAFPGGNPDDITYPSFVVATHDKILSSSETNALMPSLLANRAKVLNTESTSSLSNKAARAKIESVMMTGLMTSAGKLETSFVKRHQLAGVLIYRREAMGLDSANLRGLLNDLKVDQRPFLIAADQEGGAVQRVMANDTCKLPPAEALENKSAAQIRRFAEIMSRDLIRAGVNFNFAPVVDLRDDRNRDITGWHRSLSQNPREVARISTILNTVMVENGILTMAKHVPGIGSTINTHEGSATIDTNFERLRNGELAPFLNLISGPSKVSSLMLGHVLMPQYDSKMILPFSKKAIDQLVRQEMHFDGLIVNDAFNMEASRSSVDEAKAPFLALIAGVAPIFVNQQYLDASVDYILRQMSDPATARVIETALDIAQRRIQIAHAKRIMVRPTVDVSHGCTNDDVQFLKSLSTAALMDFQNSSIENDATHASGPILLIHALNVIARTRIDFKHVAFADVHRNVN